MYFYILKSCKGLINMTISFSGFCKANKDIRLLNYERDCSEMVPFPGEFVLLALQSSINSQDVSNLIVVAINLKSLPQPNSSSQGLLTIVRMCVIIMAISSSRV